MTIGIDTKYYLKRLALVGSVVSFLGISAVLVDRAMAAQPERPAKVAAHGEHVLSIHDRGEQRVVITKARTVREALKLANIDISIGHDIVEPALDEELIAPSYNINIYRATPVTVVDGLVRKSVTTAEQTPARIAKVAGLELHPEDQVEFSAGQELTAYVASKVMSISRATPVELVLYGKSSTVRTMATTVGELLSEKDISIGKDDHLTVPVSQKISAGLVIELSRNGVQTITVEEDVDFPVEKIQDANRDTSFREVKTPGEKGVRSVTYEIEMKNGQEVARNEIASMTIREPKQQVEVVGSKPSIMPYTGGGNKDSWLAASNIPRDQWGYADWLVQRESSWNPNAVNVSSGACGLGQQLPCGKWAGAWNDPIAGLNGMHGYVMGRYGSWENAVAHSRSKGWY